MRKNSLVSKLLVTFTAIIAFTFIIIATVLSIWFENYYFEQTKDQLDNQGKLIANAMVGHLNEHQEASLINLQNVLTFIGDSLKADILLTDNNGYVFAVSTPKFNNLRFSRLNIDEMDELSGGKAVEKRSVYDDVFNRKAYVYMKPVFYGKWFKGVIVMSTPLEQIKTPLKKVYAIIWISAIMALIVSSVVIYYFAQRILIAPLSHINIAAKKITKGEVEKRVYIDSNDEIGELAESFNTMADSLAQVEKNRRDFISNVSHELRSPITSIKGFVAGILDGVIPKDKENYYMKIVYDEVTRLSRLVNELLDLSAMEAGKLNLKISEFDINEIIRICIINLEPKIKHKKLEVDVVLEGNHLYVSGDRDRMMQVVTNLADNAVKYSGEDGYIRVTSRSRGSKVYVSIYNDGPAISEEDLKNIWDRFYKADKSRTNKVSTGLGLSIVRHILTQHGEDIWAENKTPEKGVTFTFTLKKK